MLKQTFTIQEIFGEGFSVDVPAVDPVEMQKYLEQQERKKESLAWCGAYLMGIRPETGNKYKFRVHCGYWRDCPNCFEDRVQEFEARVFKAQKDTGAYFRAAVISEAHAAKMVRKLHKENYWRIPLDESTVVLLYDCFNMSKLSDIPELVDVEDLDWHDIAMTPENKRYTGDLGRPEKEEEDSITITINYPCIEGLEPMDDECAWAEARKETEELNPKYHVDDIMGAIEMRMNVYTQKVFERGGSIPYSIDRYARVIKSQFRSWKTGEIDSNLFIEEMTPAETEELDVGTVIEAIRVKQEAEEAQKVLSEAAQAEEELFGF